MPKKIAAKKPKPSTSPRLTVRWISTDLENESVAIALARLLGRQIANEQVRGADRASEADNAE